MIRCARYLFAALQVLAVRFADLRDFFPQLRDVLLDGLGHSDRLAEHVAARVKLGSRRVRVRNTARHEPSLSNEGNRKVFSLTLGVKGRGYA